MATVVSIGRNIGAEPMSEDAWSDFRASTYAHVSELAGPVVFDGTGEGIYGETVEESYTVIGAGTVGPTWTTARGGLEYGRLTAALGNLARVFGQDAVAVTAAETSFIGADGSDRIVTDL